jgi:hypothetical protein
VRIATGEVRTIGEKAAAHFTQALSWQAVGRHALDAYRMSCAFAAEVLSYRGDTLRR